MVGCFTDVDDNDAATLGRQRRMYMLYPEAGKPILTLHKDHTCRRV
jgi:hypothetical protein